MMKCVLNVLIVNFLYVYGAIITRNEDYRLDIIHYNDFHTHFEEVSLSSSICKTNDSSCLGGFPRLYHEVKELLKEKPNAILLNAGDSFQGTYWYTLLKWPVVQKFMNMLPHDAHALGNHDFDDGSEGLVPYIRGLDAPVLAANMDTSAEPIYEGTYKPSIVVERNGRKIGIIGLITVETKDLSHSGNVTFTDPGEATMREALALQKQGVDIIVLLSHCGLEVDKQLARDYGQYIDIIVGGHTHSLLWNGPSPSGDVVAGPYPVFVQTANDENHKVLIVQASSYTKFIGNLSVYFDKNGDFVEWEGGPIFLNRSIEEDLDIKRQLEPYSKTVHEAANAVIGETAVTLKCSECGSGECLMGDFLTDVIVDLAKSKVDQTKNFIGIMILSYYKSVATLELGKITKGDLFEVLPYRDRIEHFTINGQYLKDIFEESVSYIATYDPLYAQKLLQVSGVQVKYNISREAGHRVTEILIENGGSKTEINLELDYNVVTHGFFSFIYKDFVPFMKNTENLGIDYEIVVNYLSRRSPINVTPSERLVFYK